MRFFVSKNLMFFIIMLLVLLQPFFVSANSNPYADIDTAHICLRATQVMEKNYNIKQHLLTTIASVETGRWDEKTQQRLAWPWTINAQGKGYFFNTKAEAVHKVRQLQAQGVKSIDVGCMQVNLLYHGQEFKSIEEAFDPMHNVEYAAKFLTNLYENNQQDWLKAAMAYHSSVPSKAQKYKKKIVDAFEIVKSAHKNQIKTAEAPVVKVVKKTVAEPVVKVASVSNIPLPRPKPQALKRRQQKMDVQAWREAKLEEYRQQKLLARKY